MDCAILKLWQRSLSKGRKIRFYLINYLYALVLCCFAAGCATARQGLEFFQDPTVAAAASAPESYRRGLQLLDAGDFSGALAALDDFLRTQPTSTYTQVAIFNSGRALEGLKRWNEAADRYRAVVANTMRARKLRALAMYRISFCHEAISDDSGTIAALLDARSRSADLPPEIASAELPARLAAGYARIGNVDDAMYFYSQAGMGLSRMRSRKAGTAIPDWLPRTLYFMGRMSLRKVTWGDFETALRPLEKAQGFLLQAAELDAGQWSALAADELMQTYNGIWSVLTEPPQNIDGEKLLIQREYQQRQWQLAQLVLESLNALRIARSPLAVSRSEKVESIFRYVSTLEDRIGGLLAQPLAGDGLTPEAMERREQVQGRVVQPSDELEEAYLRRRKATPHRLPAKQKDEEPQDVEPSPGGEREDPNI